MDKTPGTRTYFTMPHYVDGRCWRFMQMDNLYQNCCVFFQNLQGLPFQLIYVVLNNFLGD